MNSTSAFYCSCDRRDREQLRWCSVDSYVNVSDSKHAFGRIAFETDAPPVACRDCGAQAGAYHHIGCPKEVCPKCQPTPISTCHCSFVAVIDLCSE